MRVISGSLRGRKLRGPSGHELRPTADRLKETLFDILGGRAPGTAFLDAFAGTGSIGIEAWSRGASEVVFIESSAAACRLIGENLNLCRVESGVTLLPTDIFKALRRLTRETRSFDVAYLDPPYRWEPYADLLDLLYGGSLVRRSGRAIVEHHRKADLPQSGRWYRLARRVRQGDQCLSFYAGHEEISHEGE